MHIDKETVYQHNPEGGFGQTGTETSKTEFSVLRSNLKELSGAFGHRKGENGRTGYGADNQDNSLHGVGPNHSGDSTQKGIDQRNDARPNDDGRNIPTEHRIQRQGQEQQYRPHTSQLGQQIANGHITTSPISETLFEIMISRYAVDASIERNKDLGSQVGGYRYRKAEHEGIPISLIGIAGQSQEADAADKGGKNRHAHHPGRQGTFGGRECRGIVAGAEIERAAKQGHASHKDEENDVIEYCNFHL